MPSFLNAAVPVFDPGPDDRQAGPSLLNSPALLAPPPTAADAADWHAQNAADTWAAVKDPQTWQEAAKAYGNALLMGTTTPGLRGSPIAAEWAREGEKRGLTTIFKALDPETPRDPAAMTPEQLALLPVVYHGLKPGYNAAGPMFVTLDKDGAAFHGDVTAYHVLPDAKIHADIEGGYNRTGHETLFDPQGSSAIIARHDLIPVAEAADTNLAAVRNRFVDNPVGTERISPELTNPSAGIDPIVGRFPGTNRPMLASEAAQLRARAQDVVAGTLGSIAPTESPAFQAWFGKSVLRDAEGKPMVLYHGTNADIEKFLPMRKTGPTGPFLSADPAIASRYTRMQNLSTTSATNANVMPVYVRMENPLVHDHGGEPWNYRTERDLLRAAQAGGHDGIIWQNVHDMGGPQTQYIPLSPTQVKSAIGNRGTYDPRDPRITYGVGGLMLGSGAAAAASGGGQDQQQ